MEERSEGVILALIGMLLYGLEPVVISYNPVNPISFAFFSAFLASLILLPFANFEEVKVNWKRGLFIGFFGTFLAYLAYSFGTKMSSSVNAALITRTEVLFSFILSYVILGEAISKSRIAYSTLVIIGVVLVMTQGKRVTLNPGDGLLLLVPLFWQMGHVIAKRTKAGPQTIALLRNSFGALFLFVPALLTGISFTLYSVVEGVIIALGQLIWYSAIKRIDLSLATAIITPAPAVAIGIALITGTPVTPWHIFGFLFITVGTLGLTRD
ncbi:DMT family transporter [Pyrococcus horikoshii]|nr:DMT family transporter [Pyrococcus horikoshii]HII61198.1 DMT family transporter [Pyrococcus horikoshii]